LGAAMVVAGMVIATPTASAKPNSLMQRFGYRHSVSRPAGARCQVHLTGYIRPAEQDVRGTRCV
jgi:hypothetical protein